LKILLTFVFHTLDAIQLPSLSQKGFHQWLFGQQKSGHPASRYWFDMGALSIAYRQTKIQNWSDNKRMLRATEWKVRCIAWLMVFFIYILISLLVWNRYSYYVVTNMLWVLF